MKLTIGLVGCGRWGSNHLRVLQALKSEARLHRVVVCDIDAKKLEAIEADATYASLSQMLENEELDGLAIVTPPDTHVALAREALASTLPLLVEKPLALDHETAVDFLTNLTNNVLVVGYILRHHHGLKHLRSPEGKAMLGEVMSVRYERQTLRPRPRGAQPISTLGVHALDLIAWLLNRPLMSGKVLNRTITSDTASVGLTFPNGKQGAFEVAWSASTERRLLHVEGTSGRATLDFGSGTITMSNAGEEKTIQSTGSEPLLEEWNHFLNHLNTPEQHVYPPIERLVDQSEWLRTYGVEDSV